MREFLVLLSDLKLPKNKKMHENIYIKKTRYHGDGRPNVLAAKNLASLGEKLVSSEKAGDRSDDLDAHIHVVDGALDLDRGAGAGIQPVGKGLSLESTIQNGIEREQKK